MKTNGQTTETNNLVLFPAAKNFLIEENLEDPIHELLNEYSHIGDEEFPVHYDERFGVEDTSHEDAFDSLEAFMNRHQSKEVLTPDDKLIAMVNEHMAAIAEAKERIKFYLSEIEMFHPRRH